MQSRRTVRTGFKIRLQVAVGIGAVLVAAMVGSPFAAAAVSHGAIAASHSARVGSSRNVLVSLTASNNRQGTRALVATSKAPAMRVPHWGGPVRALVTSKAPAMCVPHWGGPVRALVTSKAPAMFVPHWGGPVRALVTSKAPAMCVPHWGGPVGHSSPAGTASRPQGGPRRALVTV